MALSLGRAVTPKLLERATGLMMVLRPAVVRKVATRYPPSVFTVAASMLLPAATTPVSMLFQEFDYRNAMFKDVDLMRGSPELACVG